MDDLSSVDWAPLKAPSTSRQRPSASGNYYPTLKPTSTQSGSSTPSPFPPPGDVSQVPIKGPSRSSGSTPANDSFANLVAFSGQQSIKNLSLQEQQRKLQDERAKQEGEKRRQFDAIFGSTQAESRITLGDGRNTPNRIISPPTYTATNEYGGHKLSKVINKPFAGIPALPSTKAPVDDDTDLFSAFTASAPVDRSSHMNSPSLSPSINVPTSVSNLRAPHTSSSVQGLNGIGEGHAEENENDPFGLGTNGFIGNPKQEEVVNGNFEDDDDDVLGPLGRPVSEFPKLDPKREETPDPASEVSLHPQDQAIAELVDMGFTSEKSKTALEATESGTDVQAAVGWLLNQAHVDAQKKSQLQHQEDSSNMTKLPQSKRTSGRRRSSGGSSAKPAWMREQARNGPSQRRHDSKSPVNGERDPSQYAAEIGTKMFKTANSLWKTGTKRLNQAVAEFNSDSDSNQPKWMKGAQSDAGARNPRPLQQSFDANDHGGSTVQKGQQQSTARQTRPDVTDEALMLEADSRPPPKKSRAKVDIPKELSRSPPPSRPKEPQEHSLPPPKFMQQQVPRDLKAKLSRQAIEEEASQAYISPARRKKATPKPPPIERESDLLFNSPQSANQPLSKSPRPASAPQMVKHAAVFIPTHPPPPKRSVPSISPFALQASSKARQEGTLAFKRGDYALATTLYSTGLTTLPSTHPLILPILTNRALSHLKTGDPKAAIADAKSALDLIGPSRGASEIVDLGGDEGVKQMITYWEKAMTRQAEALEQLERWSEAGTVWRACVEAGVGGASSIAGRNRCEKAAAVPSQSKASVPRKSAAPKPIRPKISALGDLAPESAQSTQAVARLRAANAAADRVDDEKFALADVVDSRVKKWRLGKESNLRALLSTLQNVLWEGSGWKEVGMGDLLMPSKVKINYMKGIAKVHPDKLPPTATTEQKMISAAVFATLNEAWEKFKQENNL